MNGKIRLLSPEGVVFVLSDPVKARRLIEQGYKQLSSADVRIVKQGEQKS